MEKDIIIDIIGEEKVGLLTDEEIKYITKLIEPMKEMVNEDILKICLNESKIRKVCDGNKEPVNEFNRKVKLSISILKKLG